MKFRLYKEYGALNSPEIFSAIEHGIKYAGHEITDQDEDVPVIWSVLFQGRMAANEKIYNEAIAQGKPVMIVEVGNLHRGKTWRISLDNINSSGVFSNTENLDQDRPKKIGIFLTPYQQRRRGEVLIAAQHERSLQWRGMPTMKQWTEDVVAGLQKITNRRIVIRPHPRNPFTLKISNTLLEKPKKIANTYDDFDIFYNYHCVINHNSGPAVQALIRGIPVICDKSSLAGELSNKIEDIENLQFFPREDWLIKLCHTEWTVDEIRQGIPIQRLIPEIEKKLALTNTVV
jgi:hypothetical protein